MLDRLGAEPAVQVVTLAGPDTADATRATRHVLPLAIEVEPGRAAARAAIAEGERSLQHLVDRLLHEQLPAETWRAIDPDGKSLLDVDTVEDLGRIRSRRLR
jgi:molybdopterin-guanine dinucleotide biosynthesis protein A